MTGELQDWNSFIKISFIRDSILLNTELGFNSVTPKRCAKVLIQEANSKFITINFLLEFFILSLLYSDKKVFIFGPIICLLTSGKLDIINCNKFILKYLFELISYSSNSIFKNSIGLSKNSSLSLSDIIIFGKIIFSII